jgi:hypothetical protein
VRGWRGIGTALATLAVAFGTSATPAHSASGPGDVVGKITVGYQGWFACPGDGSPMNIYWHWSPDGQEPSNSDSGIHCWPDTREFNNLYPTNYSNLGNGLPAKVFSTYDQQTVDTHFKWMQQYGIDTAALQRFNPNGGEGPTRNAITQKVEQSAQTYGVKFYIMYDVGGWTNMATEMESDWTNVMVNTYHVTSSPMYAKQNGKPVVCIWGFGFNDANHPWDSNTCTNVVNWFKSQGCYVIGGVPTNWRTSTNDSRPGFLGTYHAFNMLSPWMIGRVGNISDSDWYRTNVTNGDVSDCNANGIDYQPCVLPGDTGQRAHGDFMWHQFGNMIQAGCQGIYISMFDEFNEGNQIAKTAEDSSMSPAGAVWQRHNSDGSVTNVPFFTLDQDGTHCSSDYYLRLTGDGGKMLKGQIPFTWTRPTQPVVQPAGKKLVPGTYIALLAQANGQYVSADLNKSNPPNLWANRTAVGGWETYKIIDAGDGNIALQSQANQDYVCADNAGTNPLIANRTAVGPWESYYELDAGNGNIALRSMANGMIVCADNAGASALIANRTAIGSWESFAVSLH